MAAGYVYVESDWLNLVALADLVGDMRDRQRAYFRGRSAQLLAESKEAERRVDDALRVIRGVRAEAASLFRDTGEGRA